MWDPKETGDTLGKVEALLREENVALQCGTQKRGGDTNRHRKN